MCKCSLQHDEGSENWTWPMCYSRGFRNPDVGTQNRRRKRTDSVHPWGCKVPEGHAPEDPPRPTPTVPVHMHTPEHTQAPTRVHGGGNTGSHQCTSTHTERSGTVSTPGSQGSAPWEDFVLYLILNPFRIHYFTVINVYCPCNKSFKNKN